MPTVYEGWQNYQAVLISALRPLSPEQLALRPGQRLRSIDLTARHIIGARARWFHQLMGEGGKEFAALRRWDRRGMPPRDAAELIHGLETTWEGMHSAIARWTPANWQQTYPGDESEPAIITRPWVIWHLIEHDLHHGGEISLTLGMNRLKAPDL